MTSPAKKRRNTQHAQPKAVAPKKEPQKRNTIIRTLSFNKEIFAAMEEKRAKMGLDRSEYIERLVCSNLIFNTPVFTGELPEHLVPKRFVDQAAKAPKK